MSVIANKKRSNNVLEEYKPHKMKWFQFGSSLERWCDGVRARLLSMSCNATVSLALTAVPQPKEEPEDVSRLSAVRPPVDADLQKARLLNLLVALVPLPRSWCPFSCFCYARLRGFRRRFDGSISLPSRSWLPCPSIGSWSFGPVLGVHWRSHYHVDSVIHSKSLDKCWSLLSVLRLFSRKD